MNQPAFMADDLPDSAPALGTLVVGDEILVLQPMHHRRWTGENEPKRAVVTEKARIWITAQQAWGLDMPRYRNTWRLRLDDQTDGGESNYATRFYTADQWRFREASNAAEKYLTEQGVQIQWGSPWKGRTIELARAVYSLTINRQENGGSENGQAPTEAG